MKNEREMLRKNVQIRRPKGAAPNRFDAEGKKVICAEGSPVVSSLPPLLVGRRPHYDLAKEREGAPLFFPRCSCLNPIKLPSFSVATLTQRIFQRQIGRPSLKDGFSHPS
jgi:hypothetical protein